MSVCITQQATCPWNSNDVFPHHQKRNQPRIRPAHSRKSEFPRCQPLDGADSFQIAPCLIVCRTVSAAGEESLENVENLLIV